jgi:hypothetical protein
MDLRKLSWRDASKCEPMGPLAAGMAPRSPDPNTTAQWPRNPVLDADPEVRGSLLARRGLNIHEAFIVS